MKMFNQRQTQGEVVGSLLEGRGNHFEKREILPPFCESDWLTGIHPLLHAHFLNRYNAGRQAERLEYIRGRKDSNPIPVFLSRSFLFVCHIVLSSSSTAIQDLAHPLREVVPPRPPHPP